MDLSNFYIALVFLVPVALGLTLLIAMACDLNWAGLAATRPKALSAAKGPVAINRSKDDVGCYA